MADPLIEAFPTGPKSTPDIRRHLADGLVRCVSSGADIATEDHSLTPYTCLLVAGEVYLYNSSSVAPHDPTAGILKSVDDRRYIRQASSFIKYVVLDKDLVAQPLSPTIGDAYLLTNAPSGTDWASKARNIAVYGLAGWTFFAPKVGDLVFVEDENAYYHYPSSGVWTAGLGASGLGNDSVDVQHLAHKFGFSVVAEQSAPPGSPATDAAYIVGSAATGAWAGQSTRIAIYSGSSWIFYTPDDGSIVFDRNAGNAKLFRTSAGAWGQHGQRPVIQSWGYIEGPFQASYTRVFATIPNLSFTISADPALYEVVVTGHVALGNQTRNPVEGSAPGMVLDGQTSVFSSFGPKVSHLRNNVYATGQYTSVFTPPDAGEHTYRFGGILTAGNRFASVRYEISQLQIEVRRRSTITNAG